MKALSIRQPWAYAIAHLGKRIENRDWPSCSYRGEVLIHASLWPAGLRLDRGSEVTGAPAFDAHEAATSMLEMAVASGVDPGFTSLRTLYEHRGCIVARASIVGVVEHSHANCAWRVVLDPYSDKPERALTRTERAWWMGGFALVLDDVQAIEPVPCKGALGLWTVPADVEALIAKSLAKCLRAVSTTPEAPGVFAEVLEQAKGVEPNAIGSKAVRP